jgi:hypothetical protein
VKCGYYGNSKYRLFKIGIEKQIRMNATDNKETEKKQIDATSKTEL